MQVDCVKYTTGSQLSTNRLGLRNLVFAVVLIWETKFWQWSCWIRGRGQRLVTACERRAAGSRHDPAQAARRGCGCGTVNPVRALARRTALAAAPLHGRGGPGRTAPHSRWVPPAGRSRLLAENGRTAELGPYFRGPGEGAIRRSREAWLSHPYFSYRELLFLRAGWCKCTRRLLLRRGHTLGFPNSVPVPLLKRSGTLVFRVRPPAPLSSSWLSPQPQGTWTGPGAGRSFGRDKTCN